MGVPALFRWLSKKYPKIISPVIEELPQEYDNGDGTKTTVPIDATKPNPNGEEMDNLYLDMNGIVHPCSHPDDRPAPANEEEMMIAVFEYTERVVNMVRPRKLLMIAVDGVAPRAKMNQQRSRRFRSAQEAAEKDAAVAEERAKLIALGQIKEDESQGEVKKTWDSNAITPGTPFMDLLAASLRYWVSYKLSTDPAWENLKVIISDATVPGEGEHKIMNFVRSQRSSGRHDPNTRHVMYGLDADLIMLGLATHEPHFRILREDVFANDTKPGHCRICNQPGHLAAQCQGKPAPKDGDKPDKPPEKPFIWLHVGILREYLAIEMHPPQQNFAFDLERALDDWVFMCFFVGNDFLPHLPSLDIREDGIDTLIAIWRDNSAVMGGYLTKDGHVDLRRAQIILDGLAKQENAIFKRRREADIKRDAAQKRREQQQNSNKRPRLSDQGFEQNGSAKRGRFRGEPAPDMNALVTFAPGDAQTRNDPRYAKTNLTHADIVGGKSNQDNKSAAAMLKEQLKAKANGSPVDAQKAQLEALMATTAASSTLGKRTRDLMEDAADEVNTDPSTPGRNTPNKEIATPSGRGASGALGGNSDGADTMPEDTVKLWEDGYEERYYEQKFHVAPDDIAFRNKVAQAYVEGLCWVLLYYFQGCPSWTWYYPYHYAPFAADFQGLEKQQVKFEKGQPFRPYEQLMGVMPAASNHTIPSAFHPLMTDDDSPIKQFYPVDFDLDLNGKKFAWQGVALLPFIDEKKLLDAMGTKYPLLTEDEHRRNQFGKEALIFSNRHPVNQAVSLNFYSKKEGVAQLKLDADKSDGLSGKVSKDDDYVPFGSLDFPLPSSQSKYPGLEENGAVTVSYHMPILKSVHKSMLLPNVQFDTPVLDYQDVKATREQAARTGRKHGGVRLTNDGGRSDGRQINYAARDGGQRNGGYQNGYQNGGGYNSGPPDTFANLPPHLAAQAAQHGFPPIGMPPVPPGFPVPPQGFPPVPPGFPMPQGFPPLPPNFPVPHMQDGRRGDQHGHGHGRSRDDYPNPNGGYEGGYRGGRGGPPEPYPGEHDRDPYTSGRSRHNGGYSNGSGQPGKAPSYRMRDGRRY